MKKICARQTTESLALEVSLGRESSSFWGNCFILKRLLQKLISAGPHYLPSMPHRFRGPKILGNQGGQGLVEFVLLMAIVVLVGLGAVYKFNTAFGAFTEQYFGSYLACLIETGELPGLGGASVANGDCDAQYQPFTLAAGRPLVEDTGNGESNNGPGTQRPRSSSGSPASFRRGGGSGNSENVGGGPEGRPENQDAGASKALAARRQGEAYSDGQSGGSTRGRVVRDRRNIPGLYFRIRGASDRKASRAISTNKKLVESESLRKGVIRKDINQEPKLVLEADMATDWGGFAILRWLIIIGIFLAIIFFLGTQLMQLKKNSEGPE